MKMAICVPVPLRAVKLFPVHKMMDKWSKKLTLSSNFEQLEQNEFAIYSHKTHKLGSRHKTLYVESAISKSVKIEAPCMLQLLLQKAWSMLFMPPCSKGRWCIPKGCLEARGCWFASNAQAIFPLGNRTSTCRSTHPQGWRPNRHAGWFALLALCFCRKLAKICFPSWSSPERENWRIFQFLQGLKHEHVSIFFSKYCLTP